MSSLLSGLWGAAMDAVRGGATSGPSGMSGSLGDVAPVWESNPAFGLLQPMSYSSRAPSYVAPPVSYVPAPLSVRGTGMSSSLATVWSLLDRVPTISNTALQWFQEGNRTNEVLRTVRARENVELAALGFTTGRTRPAFSFAGGSPSVGGGVDLGGALGSLKQWLPLALGGLLLWKFVS